MKYILIALIFITGCSRKPKDADPPLAPTEIVTDTVVQKKIPKANNSLKYLGTYKGQLSCGDCPDFEALLELAEDFTYTLTRKNTVKNGVAPEQKGTYSWNKSETAIILNNIKGAPNQYFVGENTLTQLGLDGKMVQGKPGKTFVLKKLTDAEAQQTDAGQTRMR